MTICTLRRMLFLYPNPKITMKNISFLAVIAILFSIPTFAQSTAESVGAIFQASCTVGCHSGSNPSANLDLSGSATDLVAALVNVDPTNPAAQAKGYKLVDPGYPHNSFILYKCAYPEWDDQFGMDVAEGQSMPPAGQNQLAKEDVELIRQWIIYGAKANGVAVDPQLLDDYYNDNGMARIAKPDAPENGFQMHLGPFFLEPGAEVEFYKKEKVFNTEEQNVTRFDAIFNDESHHFLLFQFEEGEDQSEPEGLRPVGVQNAFQTPYMVGWVDADSTILPEGTAYKIREESVIDLNYHLINYASNGDSILAAEAYVNYYVDNETPDLIEMKSELLINLQIFIFNNGQEYTFTDAVTGGPVFDPSAAPEDSIYVWFLSSHTHKYGIDYDIYKRNPDGSRGDQLYEGFYNTTYDFNQGSYDWEHPPNLYFDEQIGDLMPISKRDGLIQEAKYQIPGSANETAPVITFGLTTNDEMMLSFIQYTEEPLNTVSTSVNEFAVEESSMMKVYPNPTNGVSTITFNLDEAANVDLNVFNSLGQEVGAVYNGQLSAGQATFQFDADEGLDPNGLYLIRLMVDGNVYTERLLHLK